MTRFVACLVIGEWWLGVSDWSPHLRDALTRGLGIGYWGIVVGDWSPQLRDALTLGLGIGPRRCGTRSRADWRRDKESCSSIVADYLWQWRPRRNLLPFDCLINRE